jgi:predicted RNA methylase
VNYPSEGGIEMTKAQFDKVPKDYRGTEKIKATTEVAAHRVRCAMGCFVKKTGNEGHYYFNVFITDAKRVDPPKNQTTAQDTAPVTFERKLEMPQAKTVAADAQNSTPEKQAEAEQIAAMRKTLKAGVQVVTAPQLFPTPAPLAAEIVQMAEIEAGMTVLEPSAGTGNLLQAIREATAGEAVRTAVEINGKLCEQLKAQESGADVHQADFLTLSPETFRRFDRVVMNPPFANAEGIKHIEHALKFLKAGSKLVEICAGGPRQAERLGALARQMGGTFENLPEGSFVASGTNVRAAVFAVTTAQAMSAAA